jgi:hypothetical protein
MTVPAAAWTGTPPISSRLTLQAPPGNRLRLEQFCLAVTAAGQNSGADPMNPRRPHTAIPRQTRTAAMHGRALSTPISSGAADQAVLASSDLSADAAADGVANLDGAIISALRDISLEIDDVFQVSERSGSSIHRLIVK